MAQVLALDIATKTGWARWTGEVCHWGVQVFDGARGAAFDALDRWLRRAMRGATEVVIEAPFYARGKTGFPTARKALGFTATVERVCYGQDIPMREVTAGEWRKLFIGRATAPKEVPKNKRRSWLKGAAIDECKRRGWDVGDADDAADALGLLHYRINQIREAM